MIRRDLTITNRLGLQLVRSVLMAAAGMYRGSWRFSLRTLLIAMTLVAIVLGALVISMR